MKTSRGPLVLAAVGVALLLALVPPYVTLAQASTEIQDLQKRLQTMTSTITVTWPDGGGTTVFYDCTGYVKSDNGTVSFNGREGSDTAPLGDHVFGHGQYTKISKIPDDA